MLGDLQEWESEKFHHFPAQDQSSLTMSLSLIKLCGTRELNVGWEWIGVKGVSISGESGDSLYFLILTVYVGLTLHLVVSKFKFASMPPNEH